MKVVRLVPLLLAGFLSPAHSDQYQDAVDKAFPGFHILGPSEIKLNKEGMNSDLYRRVKDHPGLAVGHFDSDKIEDFAAIVRGSTKRTLPEDPLSKRAAIDYYDGYLVVCYGRGRGNYGCHKIHSSPIRIPLPYIQFLGKIHPGEQYCLELETFHPPRRGPDPNIVSEPEVIRESSVRISFSTDAIGFFQTLGPGDVIYVYQRNGMYQECAIND